MDNLQYIKPSLQKRQKRRDKRLDEELIECYRHGWRTKQVKGYKKKSEREDFEHVRTHESMKFMHGGGTRSFTDNLEPLIRLLQRNCNRPWNKIFSELNKQLSKGSVSGMHVFNHVFDFVHTDVWIENKKVFRYWVGKKEELTSCGTRKQFYVHPANGLLKKAREVSLKEFREILNANNPFLKKNNNL
ncbi:hypothetical protein BH11BAC6_BH11BAC6_01440 [soil metagenome]